MYINFLNCSFMIFKENVCSQFFDRLLYMFLCYLSVPIKISMFIYFLASVFLLTSVKCPDKAQKLIVKEMQHEDTTQRINAVLRYT